MQKIGVLFVCLGNICRSPMAEGLFIHLTEEAGIRDRFEIDSAGTSSTHVGERADPRMRKTAQQHGVALPSRSRRLEASDLDHFDYVLAMDRYNYQDILSRKQGDPKAVVQMMRHFDPQPGHGDVPDPYYGGDAGFEEVYQILLRSNQKFLDHLRQAHGL